MPYRHTHTHKIKCCSLREKEVCMCHSLQNFIIKEITGKEGQILHGITPVDSKNHPIDRNGRTVAARVQ